MGCTHNSERNIYVPKKGEPGDYDYEDSHMETVNENYQVDIDLR